MNQEKLRERISRILGQVGEAQLGRAFDDTNELLTELGIAYDPLKYEVTFLKFRYNQLSSRINKGVLRNEDQTIEENKIVEAFIKYLQGIESGEFIKSEQEVEASLKGDYDNFDEEQLRTFFEVLKHVVNDEDFITHYLSKRAGSIIIRFNVLGSIGLFIKLKSIANIPVIDGLETIVFKNELLDEYLGLRIGVGLGLDNANISRTYLRGADLHLADLRFANVSKTNLRFANLSSANLSSANLNEANLSSANLNEANLSSANLNEADLSSAYLSKANLKEASLSSANLMLANLSKTNFNEADISFANLIGTNLSKANLSKANLSEANLSYANLSYANLSEANLEKTKFSLSARKYLTGQDVDISKAIFIDNNSGKVSSGAKTGK